MENLFYNSRVSEVHTSTDLMIKAFQENDWSGDVYLTKVFTSLENKSKLMAGALMRLKSKSVLDELDDERDYFVRAIFYLLTGYSYYPNKAIQKAANRALGVFENSGLSVVNESYPVESSFIISMLASFSKPKMQSSLALLPGLEEIIASLDSAQNKFQQANLEWKKEQAISDSLETATTLKREILEIVNKQIMLYLESMSQANPAIYRTFAKTIAEIIGGNNTKVKGRRKKNDIGG